MIKKEALKTPSASRCSVVFFSFSCCKKGPRDNLANHLVLFFPGEKPTRTYWFYPPPQRKPQRTYWFYSSLEKNHANRLVLFYPRENRGEQTGFILPQRKPRQTNWFYSTQRKLRRTDWFHSTQRKPRRTVWFHSTPEKTPANRLVSFSLNYM